MPCSIGYAQSFPRSSFRTALVAVGGLTAAGVAIEDGAYFKGSIDMTTKDAVQREQAPPVGTTGGPK
jgi:cytoskeletal protein CcmA (bactofilin family)